jgi:hypothetical protein
MRGDGNVITGTGIKLVLLYSIKLTGIFIEFFIAVFILDPQKDQ